MKTVKILTLVVVLTVSLMLGTTIALAVETEGIRILVDGTELVMEQKPVSENGRTMVPLRGIFEALGATVGWDGETNTAFAVKDNQIISLTIDSKTATINTEEGEKKVSLDQPAQIMNGRTMVPLRFVSEALGAEVSWDGNTRTVKIATGKNTTTTEISKNENVDRLKNIIAEMTSPSVEMTDSSYKLLAENNAIFFDKERNKYLLYDKYSHVPSKDISKNFSKYIDSIIGISGIYIMDIQEDTLENGDVLTVALGKVDGGTDYITDDYYYKIFHMGSTDIYKGDESIEVHGVLVGQTPTEFETIYGGKFTTSLNVIVVGDFYSSWDRYQASLEKGKQQEIELTDEGKSMLYGTNLHQASYHGLLKDVKLILSAWEEYGESGQYFSKYGGQDPNSPDSNGCYPIIYAASQGHTEIVKALLEAGADPNVSYQDNTALQYAESYGYTEIVKLLEEAMKK